MSDLGLESVVLRFLHFDPVEARMKKIEVEGDKPGIGIARHVRWARGLSVVCS